MFQGDQTKNHFFVARGTNSTLVFRPCFSSFSFWPFFSFGFLFISLSFSIFLWFPFLRSALLLFIYIFSTSFGTPFPSHLPSSIRHLVIHDLERKIFFVFAPQCGGWSLVWIQEEIHQAQKGWLSYNFFMSVKGWLKMAIFHFKHSYLNWRAFPCRRKWFVFMHFFIVFSTHFLAFLIFV